MKSCKPVRILLMVVTCLIISCKQPYIQHTDTDSAKLLLQLQDKDEAFDRCLRANDELRKDSMNTKSYAASCNLLASYYKIRSEYEKAEYLYLESKRIHENILGKEHYIYANTCTDLADLYSYMGQDKKAELLYLETKRIRQKISGREHNNYINSWNNLAFFYSKTGQYEKAEMQFSEIKHIQEKALYKIGSDYTKFCNHPVFFYFCKALYIDTGFIMANKKKMQELMLANEHNGYANACNHLKNFYWNTGQYKKIEPLLLESKQIHEKILGKEHRGYTNTCINLANFYVKMGQYKEAESLFLEVKKIYEKTGGKGYLDYPDVYQSFAIFYQKIGLYAKAKILVLEVEQNSTIRVGNVHFPGFRSDTGYYKERVRQLLEIKQFDKKIFDKTHNYTKICDNLGFLYFEMGLYKEAELQFLEALQIFEKLLRSEHPDYAFSCNKLALIYQKTGQYKKAELLFLKAKRIQEKIFGKHHPDYGITCRNLANLYRLMHQPLQAEKEFKESFSVKAFNLSAVFQFMNEKEKEEYISNILGEDDDAYSFFISEKIKSEHLYTLSLFHRNLILSTSQTFKKQILSSGDTVLIRTYNEWLVVKKQLSVLYTKTANERQEDVEKNEENANQLEKELTRLSSAFAKQQQQIDWKDIHNKLKADEASIEFVSYHSTDGNRLTDTIMYVALVLRKNRLLPTTVDLFNEKQLQELLSSAKNKDPQVGVQKLYSLDGTSVTNDKTSKKYVYELIWKPLEKELSGIKTIYFSPSGLLHRIAFAALPVNETELLSDRYKLVQLSTTALLVNQQPHYTTGSDKIQLYGGISYNVDTTALKNVAFAYHHDVAVSRSLPDDVTRSKQWYELPGTKKEVEGIVSLSGTYKRNVTTHSGIHAIEENIKSLDGKTSPAILHVATHGFFFPDAKKDVNNKKNFGSGIAFKSSDVPLMRSGLLFAGANNAWQNKPVQGIDDGILTAYEVSNLYLPNTKLVVLSACETGLGDIKGSEGVYGLQRAFKLAGVDNIVMSLWKVPDLETAEFMQEFYKSLFAQQNISDAFYNAQNVMKNKYRQQPYKWAAWVLVR